MSYVITAIAHGSRLPAGTTEKISTLLESLSLSPLESTSLSPDKALDFVVDVSTADEPAVRTAIKQHGISGLDLVLQKNDDARKNKQLVVFDMDSTLIYQEVIELIAAQANVEKEVARITTAAMNGEIDFKESLRRRVLLLKGIHSANLWNELKTQLRITNGARDLCRVLRANGCKMAVCSGGFLPLAEYVKEQLGLDYAFANQLKTEVDAAGVEVLSGETFGDVVDGARKRQLLEQLAIENGADFRKTVAVGDGANDLLMMGRAGLGIAWNAKPKVQQEAASCLNSDSLRDALYIFGYADEEIA